MSLTILLPVFFQLLLPHPVTTTEYFDIIRKDRVVGELIARRSQRDGQVHYHQTSYSCIKMLMEVEVEQVIDAVYRNGHLHHSEYVTRVNGKTRHHATVDWKGDHYEVHTTDDKPQRVSQSAGFSILRMLFEEPKGYQAVFSEADGDFHPLENIAPQRYEKTNPKGHVNCYDYDQRGLHSAEVDSGIIDFLIVRR